MAAPANRHPQQLLGLPYQLGVGGRLLYGSDSKWQPLRAKEIHLGEQPLSLQGAVEKLFPPRQRKAPSILGLSEIFRKTALDPSPSFLWQLGLPRDF